MSNEEWPIRVTVNPPVPAFTHPDRGMIWEKEISPGLWLAVEDSANIVLRSFKVGEPGTYRTHTVTNVERLKNYLDVAYVKARAYEAAEPDAHGNRIAKEGSDRCWCGSKYWENDRCVDCGGSAE